MRVLSSSIDGSGGTLPGHKPLPEALNRGYPGIEFGLYHLACPRKKLKQLPLPNSLFTVRLESMSASNF